MRRLILVQLLIMPRLIAPWVASAVEAIPVRPSTPASGEQSITLIHLNDLHANLVSHLDMVRVVPEDGGAAEARVEMRGGIARIATLIKQIRHENPHSLVMNVGDTFHGGIEALYTRGNAIVPAVNALGIDVGVPGQLGLRLRRS